MTKVIMNMIDAWNCKLGKDRSFQKRTCQHCQQWKWMGISPDSKFLGTPSSGFLFTKMSINTLLRMWTAFNLHISNTQRQSITLWQRILDHFAWVRETGDWTFAVHSWKLKAKDVRKYAPDPCARHSQQDLTAAGNLEEKTIDKLNKKRKKITDKATKDCTNCTNTICFHMLRHWLFWARPSHNSGHPQSVHTQCSGCHCVLSAMRINGFMLAPRMAPLRSANCYNFVDCRDEDIGDDLNDEHDNCNDEDHDNNLKKRTMHTTTRIHMMIKRWSWENGIFKRTVKNNNAK